MYQGWMIKLVLLLLLIIPVTAEAGAWLKERGKGQLIMNTSYYSTDKFITPEGNKTRIPEYSKYEINPYVEYGLFDNMTIGGSIFVQSLEQHPFENSGIGDISLFTRFKVYQNEGFIFSLAPLVKFPSLTDNSENPIIGSSQYHAELRALAGYGFEMYGRHHFINFEGGLRERMGKSDNQLHLDATIGIRPADKWLIQAKSSSIISENLPDNPSNEIKTSNDYHLSKAQLSATYNLTDSTSLEIGGFTDVYARNTGSGSGALLSVWRNF